MPKVIAKQVLYSDGVTDATGAHDRFGPERFQTVLVGATDTTDGTARVTQALAEFEVGPRADATAILAVVRTVHDPVPSVQTPVPASPLLRSRGASKSGSAVAVTVRGS